MKGKSPTLKGLPKVRKKHPIRHVVNFATAQNSRKSGVKTQQTVILGSL